MVRRKGATLPAAMSRKAAEALTIPVMILFLLAAQGLTRRANLRYDKASPDDYDEGSIMMMTSGGKSFFNVGNTFCGA